MIRILCADIQSANAYTYEKLYGQSSPERRARADRYLRYEDKVRCVTADALLRTALGTGDFRTEKNGQGKPRLEGYENLNFFYNLSHSGRYVVLAHGKGEIGVDVQEHDTGVDRMAVAEQRFAPDEQAYVGRSIRRFYEIWTGKESYLKYTGEGLRRDMRSFSIFGVDPAVRCLPCLSDDGYSLSLCAADPEYTFELLDIRQLR